MIMTLSNGKKISISEGFNDFSLALQIPIKDERVINELNKRRDQFLSQNSSLGEIGESSKNYHITLQLFFPKETQLGQLIDIIKEVDPLKEINGLKLLKEHRLLGQSDAKFPVAIIDPEQLRGIRNTFLNELNKKRIKAQIFNDFTPHVSLFCTNALNLSVPEFQEDDLQEVIFNGTPELSHKTENNQFFSLTQGDLQELSEKLKQSTSTTTPSILPTSQQPQAPKVSAPQIGMQVLGGFIAALGIGAVAVAFVALNAATLGVAGIISLVAGSAIALAGIGLFAVGTHASLCKMEQADETKVALR